MVGAGGSRGPGSTPFCGGGPFGLRQGSFHINHCVPSLDFLLKLLERVGFRMRHFIIINLKECVSCRQRTECPCLSCRSKDRDARGDRHPVPCFQPSTLLLFSLSELSASCAANPCSSFQSLSGHYLFREAFPDTCPDPQCRGLLVCSPGTLGRPPAWQSSTLCPD